MKGYELRAEHAPAFPVGRRTVGWHIVRRRHLVGLCGRLIDPVSESRSIGEAAGIVPEHRCTECWEAWTAQKGTPARDRVSAATAAP